jgi:tight adherence protein C
MSKAKRKLAYAGYYRKTAIYNFYGAKIILTLAFIGMVLVVPFFIRIPFNNLILLIYIAGAIGFFIPNVVIYLQKESRHEEFFHSLPDMLDLLIVCLDAGLGLDAALRRISDEFSISCKTLAEELQITCNSMRLGQPRREALKELAERTGSDDLRTFTTVILQAERYGTSVTNALRVHAEDLRTKRRQYAEEMAAKTSVKMVFPLIVFIMPAIFIVTAGPAVIRIIQTFSGGFLR